MYIVVQVWYDVYIGTTKGNEMNANELHRTGDCNPFSCIICANDAPEVDENACECGEDTCEVC